MMKAIAKKPSPDHHNKTKHDFVHAALKNSHAIFSHPQVPIIQLKPLCPCDGGCPRCAPVVQPKLIVGQPNNIYEQEADRVVEQVMRVPENTAISNQPSVIRKEDESVQPKPTYPSGCPSCKEEELIQPKPLILQPQPLRETVSINPSPLVGELPPSPSPMAGEGKAEGKVTSNIETQINAMRGSGQPLPDVERNFMEKRFGVDFSGVRVHTSNEVEEINRDLNAQAFTYGGDIYFGAGRYSPSTSSGKRLLAHELTHVVQQSGMPSATSPMITQPTEAAEIEAEAVEQQAGVNPITLSKLPSGTIATMPHPETRHEVPTIPVTYTHREEPYTQLMTIAPTEERVERERIERTTPSWQVPDLSQWTFRLVEFWIGEPQKQIAIDCILEEVKSTAFPNLAQCEDNTMTYDLTIAPDEGRTVPPTYDPVTHTTTRIRVLIGDTAFRSPLWLYTSMKHEYMHVNQLLASPGQHPGNIPMGEFEAYSWEILHCHETGVDMDAARMKDLGNRLKRLAWDLMTPAERQAKQATYDQAIQIIRDVTVDENWTPWGEELEKRER